MQSTYTSQKYAGSTLFIFGLDRIIYDRHTLTIKYTSFNFFQALSGSFRLFQAHSSLHSAWMRPFFVHSSLIHLHSGLIHGSFMLHSWFIQVFKPSFRLNESHFFFIQSSFSSFKAHSTLIQPSFGLHSGFIQGSFSKTDVDSVFFPSFRAFIQLIQPFFKKKISFNAHSTFIQKIEKNTEWRFFLQNWNIFLIKNQKIKKIKKNQKNI